MDRDPVDEIILDAILPGGGDMVGDPRQEILAPARHAIGLAIVRRPADLEVPRAGEPDRDLAPVIAEELDPGRVGRDGAGIDADPDRQRRRRGTGQEGALSGLEDLVANTS